MLCLSNINKRFTAVVILVTVLACIFPLMICASVIESAGADESAQPDTAVQREGRIEKPAEIMNARLNREAEHMLLDMIKDDLPEKDKALFMIGRLYREAGDIENAEKYLIKAAEAYPLLKDYALKSLIDIYINGKKYEKVVQAAKLIKNPVLLRYAGQSEITALMALNREDEAGEALFQYTERYPNEWDKKLSLARLLKKRGGSDQAVRLLKDIYLNATPLSQDALRELRLLHADLFSWEELLKRGDSLYKNTNYKRAETTYREAFERMDGPDKERTIFLIGMCQFMQKHYSGAAKTFDLIKTPEAMYWQAQAFYRRSDEGGFERLKKEFERIYPDNHYLALLYLMDADELRRNGRFMDAESNYKSVLDRFPENAEDALWGLGWLSYTSRSYKNAYDYFSRLSSFINSRDYYKYLFWRARSQEKLAEKCNTSTAEQEPGSDNDLCAMKDQDFFRGLPAHESYYGYLIKLRSVPDHASDKIELSEPERPEGEGYERIEALYLLGMKNEALAEILDSLKRVETNKEFSYLGYMALKLGAYKEVIAFAEPKNDRGLLPYSYPLGYWDTVKLAADSNDLDAFLIAALIREESRFDPTVISWAGAVGLMQLMPSTADRLKKDTKIPLKDRSQLQDPRKNILLGSYYLSQLINEFKELPLAIAAYNAGKNRLNNWMEKFSSSDLAEFIENIPYRETRKYVQRVLKSYWQYRAINGLPVMDKGFPSGE
jgi:soluble lytic murein transglycosylase